MSDFSSLCPLFNTGVYNEMTIPYITFSGCSTTMNALGGIKTRKASPASVKFQRSVVVTKIFHAKVVTPGTAAIYCAMRMVTSATAAMTAFASLKTSATATVSAYLVNRYRAMTQAANQTFLAADALGFSLKTKKTNGGIASFIVRYKER